MAIDVLIVDSSKHEATRIEIALTTSSSRNRINRCSIAATAKEAQQVVLRSTNLGLIISDIRLGIFNGFDLLRGLCNDLNAPETLKVPHNITNALQTRTPRILVTGNTYHPELEKLLMQSRATAVFTKDGFITALAATGTASGKKTIAELTLDFSHSLSTSNNACILPHSIICTCNRLNEASFIRGLGSIGTTVDAFRQAARYALTSHFASSLSSQTLSRLTDNLGSTSKRNFE